MNVFSNGSNYEFFPIPKEKIVVSSVTKVIHDKIQVDADNEIDKSHVYLEGPLPSDEFFLRCHDPEQDSGSGNMFLEAQFAVDKNGNINCGEITSETIIEIVDKIDEIDEEVETVDELVNTVYTEFVFATPDANINTFVKRADSGNNTKFNKIETKDLTVSNYGGASHVAVRGDSILYWIPLLQNGTLKPNATYRFGHNHQEIGDLTASGGGLEFIDGDEEILIQVSSTAPTIRIKGDKVDAFYIEINTANNDAVFTIPPDENTTSVTSLNVADTIMRRGGQNETALETLNVDAITLGYGNQANRSPNISTYGVAHMSHRPHLADGVTIHPDTYWAFGHNPYDSSYTALSTGLVGTEDNNSINIRCGKTQSTLFLKGEKNIGIPYIQVVDENDQALFAIDDGGSIANNQLVNMQLTITNNEEWIQAVKDSDSQAHGDLSLYVGSAKIEFNRAAYTLQQRALATSHIPKFLADSGYTNSDLPTGVAINDMSCLEWLRSARTFFDDANLQVDDIFLKANQSTDFGGTVNFENTGVATNAQAIAALGSGRTDEIFVVENDQTYSTQLTEAHQNIIWSRNRGNSSGGNFSCKLPADPPNGWTCFFHSFNHFHSSSTNNGGTISIQLTSGETWRNKSFDDLFVEQIDSTKAKFIETDRSSFAVHYYATNSEWFLRSTNHRLTDTQLEEFGKHSHHYFKPDYVGDHTTDALAFSPPDNFHRYSIVKGDGTEWHNDNTITPKILKVSLPVNVPDGCLFELHSNIHRQTTQSDQVVTLTWPGPNTQNTGRYLVVDGVKYETSNATNQACNASNLTSRRHYYRFNDDGGAGFWSRFIDTN